MALLCSNLFPSPVALATIRQSPALSNCCRSRSSSSSSPAGALAQEASSFAARKFRTAASRYMKRRMRRRRRRVVASGAAESGIAAAAPTPSKSAGERKLRILVAGGGIGGLVFALAAKNKGFEVLVFEKDLTAIRGEGQFRGPIQIQSSALAALEAIDLQVAEEVMTAGCITGDQINGLVDGVSGTWYIKFDTFTPATEQGLPVTRVISRMTLQQILANAVGDDIILNESNVIDFKDDGEKVTVTLENGQQFECDLLVGADGILLNVYRVFLGHKQYFVSLDVGAGKIQWYAFHKEPPSGTDVPNGKRERLLKIFNGWCGNVIDVILATGEEAILRWDIYDRVPIMGWGKGRVTLLGDSVHAMQPNMGQGGCMAIEDSYQLAIELEKAWRKSIETGESLDLTSALKRYERERWLRVTVIYGMARMAANMASIYRPYLGMGIGPFSFLTKFRIPHPEKVAGRFLIKYIMPRMLNWVLGGKDNLLDYNTIKFHDHDTLSCALRINTESVPIANVSKLSERSLSCRLSDKANDQLKRWFEDDDAMEQALSGEWYLFPVEAGKSSPLRPIHLVKDMRRPITIGNRVNNDAEGVSVAIPLPQIAEHHARISCKDNFFYLTDLRSQHGTWISNNEGRRHRVPPHSPVRIHPSDIIELGTDKQVIFRVKVLSTSPETLANGQ